MGTFRYYEGGISSVYFWDLDHGFAGVVLLKKSRYSLALSHTHTQTSSTDLVVLS